MNDDNYITLNEEGIAEVNPTASSDMQTAFIDNYRQTQGENTAAIGAAAHELGSDLEAPYGGLHGPSEYMKSRYQTPQTESRVAALRTAAQLSALNQLMKNDQARWNEQYNKAYRNAQKRQRARQKALYNNLAGNNGGGNGNVVGETFEEYTGQDTLGLSNEDYTSSEAPYGVTRVSSGGYVNGRPTYIDTVNAADGSPTGNVAGRYDGADLDYAKNRTDVAESIWDLPGAIWRNIFGG